MGRESQLARMAGQSAVLTVRWRNFAYSMYSTCRMDKMQRDEIRKYAERAGIKSLYHFTRIENIPTIMEHGLLSLAQALGRRLEPVTNDKLRLDGCLSGTSISVSFPNCKMLYRYRDECPEAKWAVMEIDPCVLWDKDCAFFRHNAADARMRRTPLHELKTYDAFEAMFQKEEMEGSSYEGIRFSFDPVDVQAEVMVFEAIEPELMKKAYFADLDAMFSCMPHLREGMAVHVGNKPSVFSSREYYRGSQIRKFMAFGSFSV